MNPIRLIAVLAVASAIPVFGQEAESRKARDLSLIITNVPAVQFSPDGRKLVTTSADKTVRLWDLHAGTQLPIQAPQVGTWQLVSYKYGENAEWTDSPQTERRLKLITPTHFTWVAYEPATGKMQSMAGGTYTLSNEAYTESIDFAGEGMTEYLNKKQRFTIKIEGDKLNQTGELSDGTKIEEIWQRVK